MGASTHPPKFDAPKMTLSDTAVKKVKRANKPVRLFDGKEKRLALGIYPDVSLARVGKRNFVPACYARSPCPNLLP